MGRKAGIVLAVSLAANLVLAGALLYTFNFFWEMIRDEARGETDRLRLIVEEMDRRPADIVFAGDSARSATA